MLETLMMIGSSSARRRPRFVFFSRALAFLCASGVLMLICVGRSVAADSAPSADADNSSQIGEVIVTARRREERAQDVPIAITALSAEAIEERHLETGVQLAETVPSMNVSTGTVRNAASYSIRGQGATLGAGPGVVAYFAEVPLPQGNLGSVTQGGGPGLYYDLQDIQVLNGPQGTLFGRNTTGGAVLLEPKRPEQEFGGYVQVQYGNYNDRGAEAALNIPLLPGTLALRIAGKYEIRDGFSVDVNSGRRYDDLDFGAGRIGLLFTPTEGIENYLLVNGISSHDHGGATVVTALNPTSTVVNLYPGGVYAGYLTAQQARDPWHVALSAPIEDREHLYGATDILRVKIADGLTLRNISSYQRFQYLADQDSDATPLPVLDIVTPSNDWNTDTDNYTEELQLQGQTFADHLQWVTGVYGEYDKPVGTQTQWSEQLGGSPFVAAANALQSQQYTETRNSRALYAQGSFGLGALSQSLERFKFTGGYRYTWDSKHDTTDAALPLLNYACTAFAGRFRPDCTVTAIQRSQAPTWTAGLDYKLASNVLLYGKYSTGYKTGGANPTSIDPAKLTFQPEYVKDTELGIKTNWRGMLPGTFNADVFYDKYSNIQRTGAVVYDGKTGSATVNAARATISGAEVAASVFLAEPLELAATYSYLDAHYDRFLLGNVDLTSEPFAFAPRDKFSLIARFSQRISDGIGTFKASATYSYTERWYVGVTSIDSAAWVPGHDLLDLRAGLSGVGGSAFDITAFVNNVANKEYRIGSADYFGTLGYVLSVYGEPRMFGLQLSYHFGKD
jgi:iron complex outermembrane recepter protein